MSDRIFRMSSVKIPQYPVGAFLRRRPVVLFANLPQKMGGVVVHVHVAMPRAALVHEAVLSLDLLHQPLSERHSLGGFIGAVDA